MGLEEEFKEAARKISDEMNKTASDDELKEIYSLYKQGTVGDINTDRPGMLDFKGKAKWDAWNSKKGMSKEEAMQKYVDLAKEMIAKHGTKSG